MIPYAVIDIRKVPNIISNNPWPNLIRPNLQDEIANFYGWALATQITQWLVTNLEEPKQEFYRRMQRMLNGTILHILEQNAY